MKKNKRLIWGIVSILLLCILSIVFRTFLFNSLLKPIALLLLYVLRILFFSIHQAVLWYVIIGLFCFYLLFRYLPAVSPSPRIESYRTENIHMKKLSSLTRSIAYSEYGENYRKDIREELRNMIISLYAAEKRLNISYVLIDQFKNGEIELPEDIYAFLYSDNGEKIGGFKRRKDRDFDKGVERCLSYLENLTELQSERD